MIKELITKLKPIDEITWGLYTFRRDPLNGKVPHESKLDMIKRSNECGRLEAQKLKAEYGSKTCREYAQKLGLTISEIEEANAEDYILFARFNNPDKITLSKNNIKKAEDTIEKEKLSTLLDGVKVEDVLIAHEMFHYIEGRNKEIYSSSTKILLWKLGPIKYDSGLVALGEIAAMAFAKELLQLSYYPNIFDILLLYPHDEKRAKMLYDEVDVMKGADNNA